MVSVTNPAFLGMSMQLDDSEQARGSRSISAAGDKMDWLVIRLRGVEFKV